MKNFFLNLATLIIAIATATYSQGFELMNMQASNKVATSSNFIVSKSGIEQYRSTSTTSPYAVVTGETLYVTSEQKTTSVADGGSMLASSTLQQNYPNPFNNATVIRFSLNEISDVTITVFDITGREVTTLVNGTKQSGTFSVGFSNNSIASGTYVYRMIARSNSGKTTVETKKMIVMK
ncbi:MAG: T9SS type A sorting domain-containing protein [Bacteriovoracaceae bacterium]|nr:T9SS type A sorting domain-containing protein [Bacteroidota bacterium]